ncbi:concanavalin A-like lectin/glucanase domain-containing protein [Zopfochytrium polystomum]|nr:concanavalin A-like lectin/glucanase domain-containing protein [Zopfochytrium polystomum]
MTLPQLTRTRTPLVALALVALAAVGAAAGGGSSATSTTTTTTTTTPTPTPTPSPPGGTIPTTGPNGLLALPYASCADAARTNCTWHSTGATTDGDIRNYTANNIVAVPGGFQVSTTAVDNRVYIANELGTAFQQFDLRGTRLSITVDISRVACGYNAAAFFVNMDAKAALGGGYCDGQTTCNEMDIIEANIAATQLTSHACTNGSCDKNGCASSTRSDPAFGPKASAVDTTRPFTFHTDFAVSAASGVLTTITQTFEQNGVSHQLPTALTAGNCGANGGFPALSAAFGRGMTMVFALWGSGGDGMSWLDGGQSNPQLQGVQRNDGRGADRGL